MDIKPYLTFPFLWGAIFILLIYLFVDSVLQKLMFPFLILSIFVTIVCSGFVAHYYRRHTKSLFEFIKKLILFSFLLFWIPISIVELSVVVEVFFMPSLRQEWDIADLPTAIAITALNVTLISLLLIRKHKKNMILD